MAINFKVKENYFSYIRRRYIDAHPKSIFKIEILKGVFASFGEHKSKLNSRLYHLVKLDFDKSLYEEQFVEYFWKRFHLKYLPNEKRGRKLPPIYRVVGSKKQLIHGGYIVICDHFKIDRDTMKSQGSYNYWVEQFNINSSISSSQNIPKAAMASLINRISLDSHVLKQMPTSDWRVFEEIVAEIFRGLGYEVILTKKSRDGGKDIIALQNNEGKLVKKLLIECKHWGNKIDVKPIRELIGVAVQEEILPTGIILATTSHFTDDAIELKSKPINSTEPIELDLKDCEEILNWIGDYNAMKISLEEVESYLSCYNP